MSFFGQNHGLTPFEKKANFFFFFFTPWLQSLERRFFFYNIDRDFFLPYFAKNENVQQIPLVDQNYGVTPLEKGEIFYFLIPCFYSLERLFFFLEYQQRLFFLPILPNIKTCQFFDFLNLLFLQPRMAFLSFQNIVKDIFLA